MYKQRIKKVQEHIKKENLDGLIITRLISIRYLCGFSGSSGLLIVRPNSANFITDFRYKEQSKKEVKGAKVIISKADSIAELKELKQLHGKNLRYGYESDYLTCRDMQRILSGLGNVLLLPTIDAVEQFSMVKDNSEIAMIQKAAEITDLAFERMLGYIGPGIKESEVRAELEYQLMSLGSEKPAFDTIVASGYRSALPHGVASDKKIQKGDFVTLDFGAQYNGYVSDLTRTVVVGKATSRQKKIYDIVLKAQLLAINKVKDGVEGKMVDKIARDYIKKFGFDKYFGHGLGHGIGVYVHSKPSLGPRSQDILRRGNVVTIEPGIYLPGWGGVRIEDDVVVTTTGCRVLTKAPKKMLEL
jgi:Xaa-Pro aminopeptidase